MKVLVVAGTGASRARYLRRTRADPGLLVVHISPPAVPVASPRVVFSENMTRGDLWLLRAIDEVRTRRGQVRSGRSETSAMIHWVSGPGIQRVSNDSYTGSRTYPNRSRGS